MVRPNGAKKFEDSLVIASQRFENFDFESDNWLFRRQFPGEVLERDTRIRFNPIIAPNERLASSQWRHERYFAKKLVVSSLGQIDNRKPQTIAVNVLDYWQFLRWRIVKGIAYNEDMGRYEFDCLFEDIKLKGTAGLIPGSERLMQLAMQIEEDPNTIAPFCANGRVTPSYVYEHCGVPSHQYFSAASILAFQSAVRRAGYYFASSAKGQSDLFFRTGKDRIFQFFLTIEWVHRVSFDFDGDRLSFSPFNRTLSAVRLANRLGGRRLERTRTIPIGQAAALMNAAARWVTEVGPELERAISLLRECGPVPPNQGRARSQLRADQAHVLTRMRERWLESPIADLRKIAQIMSTMSVFDSTRGQNGMVSITGLYFRHLAASCIVIIATFSARRSIELMSLKQGCVKGGEGELWLDVWIAKTLSRREFVPVPELVSRAVDILENMSATYRARKGVEWLCVFDDDIAYVEGRGSKKLDINESIQSFADLFGYEEGIPRWKYACHQFRRFFAIMYFYRFRDANLGALSVFLKHFDIGMTRRYITGSASGSFIGDEDISTDYSAIRERHNVSILKKEFEAIGEQFRIETFSSIARGEVDAKGFGGEAITAALVDLTRRFSAVIDLRAGQDEPEASFNAVIRSFARTTPLEPNGLGHGYCKCGTSQRDLALARCLDNDGLSVPAVRLRPDPTNAADLVCAGCAHNVQLPENHAYWLNAIEQQREIMCGAGSALLVACAEKRLAGLEAVYARCFAEKGPSNEA